ncbi:hypothetical protein OPQ81_008684 [Rhizoctonia solani]|nr:hypothetical protein OPQ81_008684 [Rhizoctonia solani]
MILPLPKPPPEIREDYEVKFHQPVPVPTFLCALFADRHHETILNATPVTDKQGKKLKDAFKDAFVCFSHFALAADSEMLDASALRMALFRGMAIQAKENQASIDAVIPIHMGPITSAIKTETTSAINLQFKNRKISQDFYVNQRITVPDFKQPVISIVLELGEKLREVLEEEELNRLVEVHHWDLPGTRSRTRVSGPHQDDRHYSFVARGCRPETYKAIPEAARKTYPIILASGGLKDDFPRAENKTSWELVEELKPTFIAAKCRAEWNRWDHLDTKKLPDLPTPSGTKGGMKEAKMSGNRGERKKNGGGKLKSGEKTVSGESKVARKKRKSGDK